MEAKYLFVILNFTLFFGLLSLLGESSKKDVMTHWSERRCDFDVILSSFMYKPEDDARSASEFSSDNFSFCISSKAKNYLETLFTNLFEVLKKQMGASDVMTEVFKVLRTQLNSIYTPFSLMMTKFFAKFKQMGALASRIFQHLYMAMKKAAATALASVFVAISLQTVFLNSIDFLIKIIMIVLYILIGLAFIFFLPILPFLVIVLITVAGIETAMPGSTGPMGAVFCFAKDTNVIMKSGDMQHISTLKPGDILQNETLVQAVIEVPGEKLYSLDGVLVSGYHCVYDADKVIYVKDHPRAYPTSIKDPTLWTLITDKREIPVMGTRGPLRFLDWDEIPDSKVAEKAWELVADGILNGKRNNISMVPTSAPCLDPCLKVFINQGGWRCLREVKVGDWIRDEYGWTRVTGICERIVHTAIGKEDNRITDGVWFLNYDGSWTHARGLIQDVTWKGLQLITESGTFRIQLNSSMEHIVRDFTDVGSDKILESHARVERLLEEEH
uniref:Vint domain-containing protein n=1 Tax=viral metagenome TaxID=1070528 RepID=A0A6C0APE9_9ZZZZ